MWIKKLQSNTVACLCKLYMPKNDNDRVFSVGSIWRCDECGRAYWYEGKEVTDASLGTNKDKWSRYPVADENI